MTLSRIMLVGSLIWKLLFVLSFLIIYRFISSQEREGALCDLMLYDTSNRVADRFSIIDWEFDFGHF